MGGKGGRGAGEGGARCDLLSHLCRKAPRETLSIVPSVSKCSCQRYTSYHHVESKQAKRVKASRASKVKHKTGQDRTAQDNTGQHNSSQVKPSQAKPSQAKPSQLKPSKIKPSQAKPSQAKPTQAKPSQAKPKNQVTPSQVKPTKQSKAIYRRTAPYPSSEAAAILNPRCRGANLTSQTP